MKIYKLAGTAYSSSVVNNFIPYVAPGIAPTPVASLADEFVWKSLAVLQEMGMFGITSGSELKDHRTTRGGFAWLSDPDFRICLGYILNIYEPNARDPIVHGVLASLSRGFNAVKTSGLATALPGTVTFSNVKLDFGIIYTSAPRYSTTRSEQYPMFQQLYNKFYSEIASAAAAAGNAALSSAITGGALLKPTDLFNAAGGKLLKDRIAIGDMHGQAKKIIDVIIRDRNDTTKPEVIDYNYQIVKETMMKRYGVIPFKEQKEIERQRTEEMERLMSPTSGSPSAPKMPKMEVKKPYSTTTNQLIHPAFLVAIQIFFIDYNKILMSLPS